MVAADLVVGIVFGLVMLVLGVAAFWLQWWLGMAARLGTFAVTKHLVSFVEITYRLVSDDLRTTMADITWIGDEESGLGGIQSAAQINDSISESQFEQRPWASNIALADLSRTTDLSLVGHHGSMTSLGYIESLDDMTLHTNDQEASDRSWEDHFRQPHRSTPRPGIIGQRPIISAAHDRARACRANHRLSYARQLANDQPNVSDWSYDYSQGRTIEREFVI